MSSRIIPFCNSYFLCIFAMQFCSPQNEYAIVSYVQFITTKSMKFIDVKVRSYFQTNSQGLVEYVVEFRRIFL